MASEMVNIRFLKPTLPYLGGENAWFNEIQAASYIKQGFAERVKNSPPYVPAPRRSALVAGTAPDITAALKADLKAGLLAELRASAAADAVKK